jgi:alkylhydroperoxidase family enzyme
MLELVDKLTRSPASVREDDIENLRRSGWNDVEILHIVLGTALFNYLNRVADGLGIRLEYESSLPSFRGAEAARPATAVPPARAGGRPAWIDGSAAPDGGGSPDGPRNLFLALGLNAEARDLAREWRTHHLRATPGLDARTRARLALLSAALEGCGYSTSWQRRRLAELGEDPRVSGILARGETPGDLPAREKALLAHATRLVLEPWTAREEHVEDLRRAGLDDVAVLGLTSLVAYASFETRVALGLGVALESAATGTEWR